MTRFEKQLRQWFPAGEFWGTPVYTGKTMLSRFDENLLVKVSFVSTKISQQYDALRVKILNRTEGEVDCETFRFEDIIGKLRMRNGELTEPYIWDCGEVEWYGDSPSVSQHALISNKVQSYVQMYQSQDQGMLL